MIEFFGRKIKVNDIIAYRISNCVTRIALGKVTSIGDDFIRVVSVVGKSGELKVRTNSMIKNNIVIVINDEFINKKIGAVCEQQKDKRRRPRQNDNKVRDN